MTQPNPMTRSTLRFLRSLSSIGLILGTLFFAVSLSPSLMPRTAEIQGVISGLAFSAGYLVGVGVFAVWRYLQLPLLPPRSALTLNAVIGLLGVLIAAYFLWRTAEWQDAVRLRLGLAPLETVHFYRLAGLALAVAAASLMLGRLFLYTTRITSRVLSRHAPHRLANVVGLAAAFLLFWSVANGVIFRTGLRIVDSSYQQLDALVIDDQTVPPAEPFRPGSAASALAWEDLGRLGRRYIASGPRAAEISAFTGRQASEPLRVYVGLNAAEDIDGRVALALAEMKRIGAFERAALVVVMPTGSGLVDPAAMEPLEYLLDGDVASVAVQYSYLASWLVLLTDPSYGAETARALFLAVYDHWSSLPRDDRPDLYLHGLSLGAQNSDLAFDLFDVIGDPPQGALWSGPPFTSATWSNATADRQPGSPYWLPRFRDGRVIRFMNQRMMNPPAGDWGPLRILYLQYASDPITFFSPQILYRQPQWLTGQRGPDVPPELRWYPIVTFLQLLADMAASMSAPVGFGHSYAAQHYIDGWMALIEPPDWDAEAVARLKERFASDG